MNNYVMSMPKWVWNTDIKNMTREQIFYQFDGFKNRDGYGGVMFVLWNNEGYMSEEFFERYEWSLQAARHHGLKVIIWDENGFPSGHAGGLLECKFPQYMAKRLDMKQIELSEFNSSCSLLPNESHFMGAVAVNKKTGERTEISDLFQDNFNVVGFLGGDSADNYSVCVFYLVIDEPGHLFAGECRIMSYLDQNAVDAFIDMTHGEYYRRFSQYFGDVIEYAFYDEPSFWHVKGGRIWVEDFNEVFEQKHGFSPVTLYPDLFGVYINSDTAAARNMLFSLRADLYSERYVKRMHDWCSQHRIKLTGHMDQEEITSPVLISGDLMKVFKYQDMPGVDEIGAYGRGSCAYKLVSSAAANYGKQDVMCEVFGAMGEHMPVDILMRELMDEYVKGVTFMVPHGTWYDHKNNITFPPELSFRSEKFAEDMARYNKFVKFASPVLSGGTPVCDVAVLYPIADLQGGCFFSDKEAYLGGEIPQHTDYLKIGEKLSLSVRKDFLYLHPEILGNCAAKNGKLQLITLNGTTEFSVLIIPSVSVIEAAILPVLKEFVSQGGRLIFSAVIPSKSAEIGRDNDVCEFIEYTRTKNNVIFNDCICNLGEVLADTGIDFDTVIAPVEVQNGNLSYIHKRKHGKDIWFFANSSDTPVDVPVTLRSGNNPVAVDPLTGKTWPVDFISENSHIKFNLKLTAIESVFIIFNAKEA